MKEQGQYKIVFSKIIVKLWDLNFTQQDKDKEIKSPAKNQSIPKNWKMIDQNVNPIKYTEFDITATRPGYKIVLTK